MAWDGSRRVRSGRELARLGFARVAIGFGLAVTPAGAEPPHPSRWLQYAAEPSCPDEAAFRDALAARVELAPDVAFAGLRVSVDIVRAPDGGGFRGRVAIADAAGASTAREVEDASCSAVVHASSLLAALSVVSKPESADEPDALAPVDSHSRPASVEDQRPSARAGSAADDAAVLGAAALAVMHGAMAPRMAFGAGVGAFVELPRRGAWRPWLQLSAISMRSGEVALRQYPVRTEFDAVLLEATACPVRLGGSADWSLRPCIDIDVGRLTASSKGQTLEGPLARRAPWLGVGPSLRADISIGRRVHAGLVLGANLPLARHEFYFDPDILAFRVPALGIRAASSLALSF